MPLVEVAEEDRLRLGWYTLLARLLSGAPDRDFLVSLAALEGDETELGQAVQTLAQVSRRSEPKEIEQEHFTLFVGVGQAELLPYASYYLTGFLHDRPLARLRGEMAELGIARQDNVSEPEDHIASLCEMMAGLIGGSFGEPADLATQQRFYDTHIGCWAPRFFEDLQASPSARFFMPVGTIGSLFLQIEAQGFEMAA
ncbi:TorD/DmsD family molecular chaperone [Aquibaculum arenosum]|uniref:Molecular chaperone TorD family protein n=1 Tax=Aquibaculum arenosum TaxID=3032591 RepID=A0ABT5YNN1_9PROT|nr:molecular chaperone TorD family protein [Fodinicurvata sp. CAU 1616]MDF2096548.1 molecular chaperone TorD family protein [Fodinicurvata sp. CAU 1616]